MSVRSMRGGRLEVTQMGAWRSHTPCRQPSDRPDNGRGEERGGGSPSLGKGPREGEEGRLPCMLCLGTRDAQCPGKATCQSLEHSPTASAWCMLLGPCTPPHSLPPAQASTSFPATFQGDACGLCRAPQVLAQVIYCTWPLLPLSWCWFGGKR